MSAEKARLRASAKALLAAMSKTERAEASVRAATEAQAAAGWGGASLVLAFLSMSTEIDTSPVIEAALTSGKRVAVPRIGGGEIAFVELPLGWRDWPRDRWDIPAPPEPLAPLPFDDIATVPTLALVPGLAFDRAGGRLGRGKGYYDRFLSGVAAARERLGRAAGDFSAVAYGYRVQLVDLVPTDERDRPLDGLALG
ncbi:MAG: 5-formyltetrahydrofolate cyclo-ligase [Spirochaetes bacterium GWB1_59_5]|nr:MAG: 5-formyltetrahydrofolate cyclo-ligase [Spirochaetes bacterium GWB1_59_5]